MVLTAYDNRDFAVAENADMLGRNYGSHKKDSRDVRLLHKTHILDLALFVVFGIAENRHISRLVEHRRNALDQIAYGVGVELGNNDADTVGALLTERARGQIGHIARFFNYFFDYFTFFLAQAAAVYVTADRRRRYSRELGYFAYLHKITPSVYKSLFYKRPKEAVGL